MKVSFINPAISPYKKIMRDFDCAGESKGNYLYQPYDFLLMSAFIPKSWGFQFIDAVAARISHEASAKLLKNKNPDIIVCSVAGINWIQDYATVKKIREDHPEAFLFIFGDLFVDEYPRKEVFPWVDGIFSSPLLFDFSCLTKCKNRQEFKAAEHEAFYPENYIAPKNLKAPRQISIPLPRHEVFTHRAYRWPFSKSYRYTTVFTAWGCPYSCSYCILNKFPNYWREYKEIIQEMIEVKKQGYQEIYIGDKSFGLPLSNIVSLLDEMIRLELNLSWSTYFHPNQYSKKLLDKMKLAGCHTIVIGIETKDVKQLKQYGRHIKAEQFKELLDHAGKIGMEICGDFIIGLPHDTKESLDDLIDYACELKIDYASFNVATPLPGSAIRELAIKTNKLKHQDQQFDSSGNNNIFTLTDLTNKEILAFRDRAIKNFYLRPSYLLRRLVGVRSIEHLKIQMEEGWHVLWAAFFKGN